MIKLKGIGHVNLRVADEAASKRFYTEILGFLVAEEDPEHGGVFMTLGDNFHTIDIRGHDTPATAPRPQRGQIGLGHIAFEVHSYPALRDAYMHLVRNGVEILRATNHVNQRTRWSCSPADAATMTRRCRSAARTIPSPPGWSRIGPVPTWRRGSRRCADKSNTRRNNAARLPCVLRDGCFAASSG